MGRRRAPSVSTYRLSEASADEYVPDDAGGWLSAPPFVLLDAGYALVALVAVGALTGARAPGLAALAAGPLQALAAARCGFALAAAAAVFALCRALPTVSRARALHYEAALLRTVRGDVRHHWTRFTTPHASWHVHSLQLRSAAHAREDDAAGRPGAAPQPPPPGSGSSSSAAAAAAAGRPQLVILHGHSSGAAHWEAVLDRLSPLADVHVLDMPGWGRSPSPRALSASASASASLDLVCEMVAGWLRANGLSGVLLLGHSLGGFYAVHLAHRYPALVRQLLLVAPAGLVPVMPSGSLLWGAYFKWAPPQRVARVCGRGGYALFRSVYLALTTEDPRFPDLYYQLAAASAYTGCADRHSSHFMRWTPSGGLYWSHPCLSLLMALDCPVSVLWGSQDELLPPALGALLHRIRPRTDVYFIRGALHNPAHNNAPAFCDAVADAVLKHAGRARTTLRALAPDAPPPAGPAGGAGRRAVVLGPLACADGTADRLLAPGVLPNAWAVEAAPACAAPEGARGEEGAPAGAVDAPLAAAAAAAAAAAVPASALAPAASPSGSAAGDGGEPQLPPGGAGKGALTATTSASTSLATSSTAAARRDDPSTVPATRGGEEEEGADAGWGGLGPATHRRGGGIGGGGAHVRVASMPSLASCSSALSELTDGGGSGGAHGGRHRSSGAPTASIPASTPSRLSLHGWRNDWAVMDAAPGAGAFVGSGGGGGGGGGELLGGPAPPAWGDRHHDGVVAPVGRGRGYCHGCFHAVGLHKAYWRCGCGLAWTFNAHWRTGTTAAHFAAQLAFLDELYVAGNFDARSSATLVQRVHTRTPLPRPHPPAAVAAMQALLAAESRSTRSRRRRYPRAGP